MKVVLDTNVYVSAAISSGAPGELIQRWIDGRNFEVLICPQLMVEVEGVLLRRPVLRRWISIEDAHLFIHRVRELATNLPDPREIGPLLRDANDDFIIHFAREHNAKYVITGDKDFESWGGARPHIVSPRTFVTLLGDGGLAEYRWYSSPSTQLAMTY